MRQNLKKAATGVMDFKARGGAGSQKTKGKSEHKFHIRNTLYLSIYKDFNERNSHV